MQERNPVAPALVRCLHTIMPLLENGRREDNLSLFLSLWNRRRSARLEARLVRFKTTIVAPLTRNFSRQKFPLEKVSRSFVFFLPIIIIIFETRRIGLEENCGTEDWVVSHLGCRAKRSATIASIPRAHTREWVRISHRVLISSGYHRLFIIIGSIFSPFIRFLFLLFPPPPPAFLLVTRYSATLGQVCCQNATLLAPRKCCLPLLIRPNNDGIIYVY